MLKALKILFYFITTIYIIVLLVLFLFQERLIFWPTSLPQDYTFKRGKEFYLKVDENVELSCLKFDRLYEKGVVLYLHGNRGSNKRCSYQANKMYEQGYDIYMPDYRGYGKSDGKIHSEQVFFDDVQILYNQLKEKYGESKITIIGYSIGTGAATYLAANNSPKNLILLAPYTSVSAIKNNKIPFGWIIPNFLIKYQFDNKKRIKSVKCPIDIFHGNQDKLIDISLGKELANQNNQSNFHEIKGAGHRAVLFHNTFLRFLRNLH